MPYKKNIYDANAQKFIISNLNKIAADIAANEVRIAEMYDKRIYLVVDAQNYMIHTKNFKPVQKWG